jgi:hypothetical protein
MDGMTFGRLGSATDLSITPLLRKEVQMVGPVLLRSKRQGLEPLRQHAKASGICMQIELLAFGVDLESKIRSVLHDQLMAKGGSGVLGMTFAQPSNY